MEKDKRLYPAGEEQFNELVAPVIEASYIGRPPTGNDALRGLLRDTVYAAKASPGRIFRVSTANGIRSTTGSTTGTRTGCGTKSWQRCGGRLGLGEVIIDSTTMKVHRHGDGQN